MSDSTTPAGTADEDATDAVAEVTMETASFDLDGDGVVDAVAVVTTTVVDVDGDGVADVVSVVEAIGVDVDGDGVIDDDEIAITETIYVRDDTES